MDGGTTVKIPSEARLLLPELLFGLGIFIIGKAGIWLSLALGTWAVTIVIPCAPLLAWLLGGYLRTLVAEYKVYNKPDVPKITALPKTIFDTFLVIYCALFLGQGFFLYPLLLELFQTAPPQYIVVGIKVLSFAVPFLSALYGYMYAGSAKKKKQEAHRRNFSAALKDNLYGVVISLVLYVWLRFLVRMYIPAIMRTEMLFSIPLMMFALLVYGPFPLRLVIALRPPFKILKSIVSVAILVWLALDTHAEITTAYEHWLSEDAPLHFAPGRLLSTPLQEDFDSWDPSRWYFFNKSSEQYTKPPEHYISKGNFFFRGDSTYIMHSVWYPVADSGVIHTERRLKFDKGSGAYTSTMNIRLSGTERRNPMMTDGVAQLLSIQYADPGFSLPGADTSFMVLVNLLDASPVRLLLAVQPDTWFTETITIDLASGSVTIAVGEAQKQLTMPKAQAQAAATQPAQYSSAQPAQPSPPQLRRVWSVLLLVQGEYRQKTIMDWFAFY